MLLRNVLVISALLIVAACSTPSQMKHEPVAAEDQIPTDSTILDSNFKNSAGVISASAQNDNNVSMSADDFVAYAVEVDEMGELTKLRLKSSSGNKLMDKSAERAIKKTDFPANKARWANEKNRSFVVHFSAPAT